VNGPSSAIKDRLSLGQTHSLQVALLFSVRGMAQDREWFMLRNQDSYSSLLEKNSLDSPSLMFYSKGRCSSRSHRCEWKNGPDDSVYIITMFFVQVDIR
jgi:hypothetical protein